MRRVRGTRSALNGCGSLLSVILTLVSGAVGGCATASAPAPTSQTITCDLPVITPQPETKQRQEKGGLEISIAPANYTAERQDKVTLQQAQPPTAAVIIGGHQGSVYVEKVTEPRLLVTPEEIRFVVTIVNKMPRVFHGAGTVVQFNVGGQVLAVDQRGYTNLLGAIIPPRQQQQVEIIGPPLSSLKAKQGIVGVFLYDVVTNQNEAGVVTEKQNFEWYFSYSLEPRSEEAQEAVQRGWMPVGEFQQEMSEQAMESARQRHGVGSHRAGPGTPGPSQSPQDAPEQGRPPR